ncbi:DEAD/DEAH box helicase [Streptomyces griseoviridis]|uniref:DEAD/DEAH box helicase n=1 Tax=Streptomyces griseoviridis TaxID=45398 RepID=UPI0033DB2FD5
MTLPVALSGSDVIGQAKTGTGKTLGFGLPLLERVTVPADVEAGRASPEALTDAPQALVVVPTRELCQQVTNDLQTAGKVRNVRVTAIYGGRAYEPQVETLRKGVDVVVGTPGRLLDLAGQKKLDLKHVKSLVLDEADEMLDLGFLPDVEKIINLLPAKRQTMLFSATMPGAVIGLARRYMSQPTHISATTPDDTGATVANIAQHVFRAHSMDKPEMVSRILQADGRGLAMIFCRTKRTAADIAEQLQRRGFASGAVHGDLGQGAREQALRAFRNGKVDVLVCTDVAARGIDVEGVTHVINYQCPEEEKTYLHRIGRTGRAGNSGTAITLVDWDDIPRWQLINKALELTFNDPPETYSTSPHLFEELRIPAGTKGVLPRTERTRAGLAAEEVEDLGETGGRGPRGRSGRGAESRPAEQERPARTPRRRRRTRGGAEADGVAVDSAPAPVTEEQPGGRTPRRRRRTRGGGGEPVATPVAAAETVVAAVESPALDTAESVETPGRSRRRRTRRSSEPATTTLPQPPVVTEAPVVAEAPVAVAAPAAVEAPVAVEVPEPEVAVAPRRRTRKAAVPAETAVDTAEAVEAKPRRRTRKAAEPAEAVTAEAEVAEATPRRTRKAAATVAETVVDTVEAAEAKPKARRTRKTAATAPEAVETAAAEAKPRRTRKATAAETAVDTAEGTETKPRRTRKTAAAAPEAVETAVEAPAAEPKPRRTRKATAAETAVDTAEGTETKPRRTRKPAATATPDTTEVTEAKPRRTRKTAAAAPEAVADTVEAAEAKPKARRTRKTAATAEIPAQAAEEPTEAKPRRTRKAATTAPEAVAEEKPKVRRPRKAAVPVEAAES